MLLRTINGAPIIYCHPIPISLRCPISILHSTIPPFFLPPIFCGCGLDDLLCIRGELGASLFDDSGLVRVEVNDSLGMFCPSFSRCIAVTQFENEGASSAWRRNSAPCAVLMRKTNFFFELLSTVVVLGTTSMEGSSDGLCWEERRREGEGGEGGGGREREREGEREREREINLLLKC